MAETYTLHVAGLTRELTICKVNDHMDIAAFNVQGISLSHNQNLPFIIGIRQGDFDYG